MSRELLELAPGGYWGEFGDGRPIATSGSTSVHTTYDGGMTVIDFDNISLAASTQDVIALLHRAGLLDELLAEAWDDGASEAFDKADGIGWSAVALDKFYAGNPYRKAGK